MRASKFEPMPASVSLTGFCTSWGLDHCFMLPPLQVVLDTMLPPLGDRRVKQDGERNYFCKRPAASVRFFGRETRPAGAAEAASL